MTKHVMMAGLALTFVAASALIWGCGNDGGDACCGTGGTCCKAPAKAAPALCVGCGQFKGSNVCCSPSAVKCAGCGLAKGSPGCCKIPADLKAAGKPVALCTGCGQIKGTDLCCKADAEKCAGCGLAKGSPGCCKLPK